MSSENRFVGHGITLFLDQLITSAGNWFFWIMVSRLATIEQIGEATAVYSLVLFISSLAQLGLEYPLLKNAAVDGRRIIGSVVLIESCVTTIAVVILLYMSWSSLYHESLQTFVLFAVLILISSAVTFVFRFALLGIFKVRDVFILDIIGTAVKFAVAYGMLSTGSAVSGLLAAFVAQNVLIGLGSMFVIVKTIGTSRRIQGVLQLSYLVDTLKASLANAPAKLSRALIISLSVVLATFFGVSNSDIGIFYIVLMVSVIAGSLASSIAVMVIPANSPSRRPEVNGKAVGADRQFDSTFVTSLRLGLCLSVPFISLMVVAPAAVLMLLGGQYVSAGGILAVLSISIFPQALIMNSISQLNARKEIGKIMIIGAMQAVVFLTAFTLLVPSNGTFGAALAILIGYSVPSILSLWWYERAGLKYVAYSGLAVACGVGGGFAAQTVLINGLGSQDALVEAVTMAATAAVTALSVLLLTKSISVTEIVYLGKTAVQISTQHGHPSR